VHLPGLFPPVEFSLATGPGRPTVRRFHPMITWIQRYFQHHFKTVFAVLLALIIISFVFITNTSGGLGEADRRMVDRPFFKYNLGLESDQRKLFEDAGLSLNLRTGGMGGFDGSQMQNYAFHRAASLHLADQWHIPDATPAEIESQIKALRMFSGQDGQFDPKAYQTFRDNLKTNPRGVKETDIVRVLSDDSRAEKVQKLLAGPGYVLPAEVKTELARAETSWTIATASADYATFKPEIKPTDAELTQFFENSGTRYDIPARVVVSYVEFPTQDFLANVSVTEAEVRAYYDANPVRFPKPADPAKPAPTTPNLTPSADPAADFAAVRPQVEDALKLERAQRLASTAASDLAVALYNAKATTSEAIDKFLASKNRAAKALPPFTREAPPMELGGSPEVAAAAFRLGTDRVVSDVLRTPLSSVILIWRETLPSQKPLFAQARDRVVNDYTENARRKRFAEVGKTVKEQLEIRIKAGDTFDKAAETASSAGVKLVTKNYPAFTPRGQPPQDLDYSVLGTLEKMEKGQVSDMVLTADKGLFVHVVDKKLPDVSEANPQFAETRKQIARYNGQIGVSGYINELVETELKKSEPKVQ
jgi:peptidyl-prolyl cis-trans isomerase D